MRYEQHPGRCGQKPALETDTPKARLTGLQPKQGLGAHAGTRPCCGRTPHYQHHQFRQLPNPPSPQNVCSLAAPCEPRRDMSAECTAAG